MADQARLIELCSALNESLEGVTPYRIAVAPPREIEHVDKNAHYMSKRVFDQLVANVKRDGNLSSLPFCWKRPDGKFIALSGNHRVDAAREAGVPLLLLLYTDEALSRSQKRAIQVSHNALVGADNPAVLKEIWAEIDDLGMKVYSGLDDAMLKTMDNVDVARISDDPLRFEDLHILFIPSEVDRIKETLGRLGNIKKARLAAPVEDFDRFFEMLLTFKEASGILNTGTAFRAMMDIVEAWIAEHIAAEHDASETS